jgi:hypothetical protein
LRSGVLFLGIIFLGLTVVALTFALMSEYGFLLEDRTEVMDIPQGKPLRYVYWFGPMELFEANGVGFMIASFGFSLLAGSILLPNGSKKLWIIVGLIIGALLTGIGGALVVMVTNEIFAYPAGQVFADYGAGEQGFRFNEFGLYICPFELLIQRHLYLILTSSGAGILAYISSNIFTKFRKIRSSLSNLST